MKSYTIYICMLAQLLLFAGCNDMYDVPHSIIWNDSIQASRLLVLCEGLFNMNNSTLAMVNNADSTIDYNVFLTMNGRGLGDTANDMKRYGDKIYITVNVSSQLEVIDANTLTSIKQIPLFNESGVSRQPRCVAFYKEKAFVSCFDGFVAVIDTASLEIEQFISCGRNPDQLAVSNGKLYVSNSGGLDFPFYDNTVSVIDLSCYKEIKRIEVGLNPGSIGSDSQNDIYVISRGDYSEYTLHKIDTEIDTVVATFNNIHPLNMKIVNDIAYMYSVDYNTKEYWIKQFDCITDDVINEQFVSDCTDIRTPYGIEVDSRNGDVYICEAYDYVVWGDLLCFNRFGKLKFRLDGIGLNPNNILIY
ncbi:MAG: YncE family protein [Candidatus Aphodosoma sp.]